MSWFKDGIQIRKLVEFLTMIEEFPPDAQLEIANLIWTCVGIAKEKQKEAIQKFISIQRGLDDNQQRESTSNRNHPEGQVNSNSKQSTDLEKRRNHLGEPECRTCGFPSEGGDKETTTADGN